MNYSRELPPYEAIANEYYDDDRHPTCRNFGELSTTFLRPRIRQFAHPSKSALEVGAGKSILAGVFDEEHALLSHVTILDQSSGMLKHSKRWINKGAVAIIGDARRTGLQKGAFDLVVASLGDPYNCEEFWCELRRLTSEGGSVLFTTPSYEWSSTFRSKMKYDKAEFVLRDDRVLLVPSFTWPLLEQRRMMMEAGFEIAEEVMPTLKDIGGFVSPKLGVLRNPLVDPILYCFMLRTKVK